MTAKNPQYDEQSNAVVPVVHGDTVVLTMSADAAEWMRLAMFHYAHEQLTRVAEMPESLQDIMHAEAEWLREQSNVIQAATAPVWKRRDAEAAAKWENEQS